MKWVILSNYKVAASENKFRVEQIQKEKIRKGWSHIYHLVRGKLQRILNQKEINRK